jgi:hypothetical protein
MNRSNSTVTKNTIDECAEAGHEDDREGMGLFAWIFASAFFVVALTSTLLLVKILTRPHGALL